MSSAYAAYLNYVSNQLSVYLSSFFYFSGFLSNALCILMFLSMKRLRGNPSSTYLLASSIGNFILFNTSYLSRILLPNFIIDPSAQSLLWCKLRQFFGHWCALTSLFCTAWAMMDQYLSTSANARLRQTSTGKVARLVVSLTCLLSFLQSLPLIIYNQVNVSNTTNTSSCSITNNLVYQNYVAYFVTPFLIGIIPISIMIVFALLAYANANYLHQEQMRTQIQQQLTQMVSAQVLCVFIGTMAYTAQTIYSLLTMSTSKSVLYKAIENVTLTITGILAYTSYAFNFYIYMIVSPSLRKRVKKLLIKRMHYGNHSRPVVTAHNRIAPMITEP